MQQPRVDTVRLVWAVLVLAAGAGMAFGADPWSQFRGPNGQGTSDEKGIPLQWTDADWAWKTALPGGGHSSPVVWGDRIFITSADEQAATRILLCLRLSDGSILWKREFASKACHLNSLSSYAVTTPPVDESRVYFSWGTPEEYVIVALDHDGKEVWRRDLGPFVSQHGHGPSPMVFNDMVIVPNDQDATSFVIALDSGTGKTRWQLDRKSDRAAYSTPCVFRPASGPPQIILTSSAHGVTGVDPTTGRVIWEKSDAFPQRVVSSPVAAGGVIMGTCGTGGSGKHLIAIRPPDRPDGQPGIAWTLTKNAPYVPTPVVLGDLVFGWTEGGVATCLRLASGEEVWRERVGGNYYASPVVVGGRLYNVSVKGEVVVLAAGEKYELLARNTLGEKTQATPAVAGGRMIFRTWSNVMALGGK